MKEKVEYVEYVESYSDSVVSKDKKSRQEDTTIATSEAEKKLIRKMNIHLVPFLLVVIFLQFLDKQTLTTVSIMPRFMEDTHITHDQYGWVGSVFYLGYLLMQVPNNLALHKFSISKYLGIVMFIWGGCLLSTAFATSFAQLMVIRILLGFFEAVTYPAVFILISTLYRRSEHVFFFGLMGIANAVASISGGLLGLGFTQMPDRYGIVAWQWAFIIYGSITMFASIFFFFFLPDNPYSRWFSLTEEEKEIVELRIRDNAVVPVMNIQYDQIWEAIREPRFYCYNLISFFINIQNGAIITFSAIIIKSLGFSTSASMLIMSPMGLVSIVLVTLTTYLSRRYNEIIYVAFISLGVLTFGMICMATMPNTGIKLIGVFLAAATAPVYLMLQTSISNNVSGYSKKIFYTSANLVFYTSGNFTGPLMIHKKDAPRYLSAMGIYLSGNVLIFLMFMYVRYTYIRENKRRSLDKNTTTMALTSKIEDITDAQNKQFVYRP